MDINEIVKEVTKNVMEKAGVKAGSGQKNAGYDASYAQYGAYRSGLRGGFRPYIPLWRNVVNRQSERIGNESLAVLAVRLLLWGGTNEKNIFVFCKI